MVTVQSGVSLLELQSRTTQSRFGGICRMLKIFDMGASGHRLLLMRHLNGQYITCNEEKNIKKNRVSNNILEIGCRAKFRQIE